MPSDLCWLLSRASYILTTELTAAFEGLGYFAPSEDSISWPGGDAALLVLLALWALLAWAAVRLLSAPPQEAA